MPLLEDKRDILELAPFLNPSLVIFHIFSGQGEAFETSVKNYLGEKELKDQFIALRFVLNIF